MTRKKKGYTLIEILVVVVVLGILAGIAVMRYSGAKDKANAAVMKADLHNAAIFEEQYAAEHDGVYFSGTVTADSPTNGFKTSPDITITLTAFSLTGSQLPYWTASAKHTQSPQSCETKSGMITCTTENAMANGLLPTH